MEKLKITKELVYKKGLAVVIKEVEETASEYRSDWKTTLMLYFKSKNAITNASKILGYKLDKKRAIEAFDKGKNGFQVTLDGETAWILQTTFGYKDHIGKNGYLFIYSNDYSDSRINERVNPPDIFKGISESTLEKSIGSCADSHGTFKEYLESILVKINKGSICYCPSVY
ncbi:hypothetical protein NE686_18265 [Tissierella carlieri]|uniref:Uncharacterized protein n=1 Tax=Tissierella carlieri TaxID=689904 RepID=A0ABT1SGK7_9FIRM|nr:hypothetical protein [Tissierella carlieri]MCQ4925052.1 hypothetical protein [Tissierella carlieri]